jgi:hypothetical protein
MSLAGINEAVNINIVGARTNKAVITRKAQINKSTVVNC